jgi:hypothetical protein
VCHTATWDVMWELNQTCDVKRWTSGRR